MAEPVFAGPLSVVFCSVLFILKEVEERGLGWVFSFGVSVDCLLLIDTEW